MASGRANMSHVVYVETKRSQVEIRDVLQRCGKIQGIYPWPTRSNTTQCFVEFDDKHSAQLSMSLRLPDLQLRAAQSSPRLSTKFSEVAYPQEHPGYAKPDPYEYESSLRTRTNTHWSGDTQAAAAWPSPPPSAVEKSFDLPSNSLHRRSYGVDKENQPQGVQPAQYPPGRKPPLPSTKTVAIAHVSSRPPHSEILSNTHENSLENTLSMLRSIMTEQSAPSSSSAAQAGTAHQPFDGPPSHIVLSHRGELVHCNLESLDEDPSGIISLLRIAANHAGERDKWMIVGGYYRSKGNVGAAATVISAMIETLTSPPLSLPSHELRPAFLMLSSCHTDLAKRTRSPSGGETAESAEHLRRASELLRTVYGTHTPTIKREEPSEAERAAIVRSMDVSPQSLARGYPADCNDTPGGSCTPRRHREPSTSHTNQITDLEREVQSLRDKQSSSDASVSQLRESKRKLEDDLNEERRSRRRIERAFDSACEDLEGARRGERSALEQCRHEIEVRRRAEARIQDAETELATAKREVRAVKEARRKDRETFGRLATMFMRMSKGEDPGKAPDLPGLSTGSDRRDVDRVSRG